MKNTPKILREQEIRLTNFLTLISKLKSKTLIAEKISVHPSYITHILKKKEALGLI